MNNDLGEQIKILRNKVGLTQEQLAENSGLSVNYISKIERTNSQNVSIKSLIAISEALKINIVDFFISGNQSEDGVFLRTLLDKLRKMDKMKAESLSMSFLQIIDELYDNK
ncbi:helix-turn-helix transcriptional regulator [Pediococcus argentinicus]|uniref:helix-turn-helix domain-containing protein n=1 Tax=Pediococcus argentinicus TaxID=480391 RepID=UPI00338FC445